MSKSKKLFLSTIILAILYILFTLTIAFVDKGTIGPNASNVGLSHLNEFFKNLIGQNELFYKISKIFGFVIFGIILAYFIVAFIQIIKRKSIKKVDKEIWILGIFYIILVLIYFAFELLKINYRPVLVDGKLEPSYPSSHTLFAIFICVTAIYINNKIITNKKLNVILNTIISLLGIITIIGRLLSGVHWITDIIGGLIISTTLVLAYITLIEYLREKDEINKIDTNPEE